jgi:hypothetical protein
MCQLAYTPFNLAFVQGNTPSLTVTVTEADGVTLVDITDATIYLTCKADPGDTDDDALFQLSTTRGDIVIPDQSGVLKGQYIVTFPAAATEALSALLKYPYDSKVELGGNLQTVIGGTIQLTQAITRA